MWINRKKLDQLEKRVADLEKNQLQAMSMVKNYIEDQECLSNKVYEMLKSFPKDLQSVLINNSYNK